LNARADLSRLVLELRQLKELTQEKFAARLGVTYPTINRWDNGCTKSSPLAMQQIEELLHGMGKDGADLLEKFFPQDR